jgi:DNA sulfur modification protein DndD
MFKGEAELNIFESDSALENLINLFSDAKHYYKFSEKGSFLREKAEKAVEDSSKLDRKNESLYTKLESEIFQLENEKEKYKVHLNVTENEIKKIEENLQDVARYVSNADALETYNKRIKEIENNISQLTGRIDENYTTSLFDENWILVDFEPFQKEFSEKITSHSKKKRELQSEFDKQKGIIEGEKKAKAELLNNVIPLPLGVPSKSHMEEMLNEEICKVCNREAQKGSEAYEFMMKRLKAYLVSQTFEETGPENDDPLFMFDYTNRLENISISHEDNLKNLRSIKSKIKELFEFNNERKKDIEELIVKLDIEKLGREKILGNSRIGAEKLSDVLVNYNGWQEDLKNRNQDFVDYSTKLRNLESALKAKKDEKDKIDTSSAHAFLIKTRNILRDIETIFLDTKEKKFDEFIEKLNNKSITVVFIYYLRLCTYLFFIY